MKKTILFLALVLFANSFAQELKNPALVTVMGEGKLKIVPDQVSISIAIETKGSDTKLLAGLTSRQYLCYSV